MSGLLLMQGSRILKGLQWDKGTFFHFTSGCCWRLEYFCAPTGFKFGRRQQLAVLMLEGVTDYWTSRMHRKKEHCVCSSTYLSYILNISISGRKLQTLSVDFKGNLIMCLLTITCLASVLQHLSASNGGNQVDASFMQTLWNIQPTCSSGNMAVGKCTACSHHTTNTWLSSNFNHFCTCYSFG